MDADEERRKMEEKEVVQFHIEDRRGKPDDVQRFNLAERLVQDRVGENLAKAKVLFGEYGVDTKTLDVNLVEGALGEGQYKDGRLEVKLPQAEEVEPAMMKLIEQIEVTPEQCREVIYAMLAQKVLHEGAHVLIDSKPGSKLAVDLERVAGLPNEGGKQATLLDEGIVYAIMAIWAPSVEPLGSLAPVVRESDEEDVRQRKELGVRLRPKVEEYLNAGKVIDEEFLKFAGEEIQKMEGED